MKRRNLILAIIGTLLLSILCAAGGIFVRSLTGPLPDHDGIVYLQGVSEPITISRDAFGVPHIYASNADDLFFAQGYVHAQDRWWQMDMQRRLGMGEISTATGFDVDSLNFDLMARTWGWNRATEADLDLLGSETQIVLSAYTAGVNAYISGQPPRNLALEYSLLAVTGIDVEVEPWSIADTIVWSRTMAWGLGTNAEVEIERAQVIATLGEDMAADYYPAYPFETHPTIITADDFVTHSETAAESSSLSIPADVDYSTVTMPANYPGFTTAHTALGSNNWTISGEHTSSGQPILANDMHLDIQAPNYWYQVGLHCRPITDECPYDVVGFSFAGVPAVVAGHNAQIAWGQTNGRPDVQDLYILQINPDDSTQYGFNGEWRYMTIVTEEIDPGSAIPNIEDDPTTPGCEAVSNLPLNDAGNIEITVRVTHFGPVITDNIITDDCRFVAQPEDSEALALRWTALESGDPLGAIIAMNKAADWESFRTAAEDFAWPPQNFVYADVDGNIGYILSGMIPVRAEDHDGQVPVPGWTDEYTWRGLLPPEHLPSLYNPARGWIATANHAVAPPDYYNELALTLADQFGDDANFIVGNDWHDGYRAQQITQLITDISQHSVGMEQSIQGDNHNMPAQDMLPYLIRQTFVDPATQDYAQWLAGWDLQNTADSPYAALYEMYWLNLVDLLYNDQLPFASHGPVWATYLLMDQPENLWWDDASTSAIETRDDIIRRAFEQALEQLAESQGEDHNNWHWGDLHTAEFEHLPFGGSSNPIIRRIFNIGPIPVSGGSHIINATSYRTSTQSFIVYGLPSERAVYDLADFDESTAIHTTGQSGHALSPQYRDMAPRWQNLVYNPLNFSDEAVAQAQEALLELRPSAGPDRIVQD